ncbi:MAG: hypothetical protein P1V19_16010 [Gimesia sp.]|nr:hypothetical protein [Gimesia sp.]
MRFLFRVLHVLAVLAMPLFSAEFAAAQKPTDGVLVEAESFNQQGGWKLDTQFINIMGSPYLLAHGL